MKARSSATGFGHGLFGGAATPLQLESPDRLASSGSRRHRGESPSPSRRALPRPFLLALVSLLAVAGLTVATAPAAQAFQDHTFAFSFDGSDIPSPPSPFKPNDVAVNRLTHDVFVVDQAAGVLYRFSSAGAFESQTPIPPQAEGPGPVVVDNTGGAHQGEVYVGSASTNFIAKFAATGVPDGLVETQSRIENLTLDGSGNLYVVEGAPESHRVSRYSPDGTPDPSNPLLVGLGGFLTQVSLAFDSTQGFLYASLGGNGASGIYKFDLSGAGFPLSPTTPITPRAGNHLGVDPATGYLYAPTNGQIEVFDPAGDELTNFGSGVLPTTTTEAVNGLDVDSGSIYVAVSSSSEGKIDVFSPITVPDATTEPASALQRHAATLNGHLDPLGAGDASECHFQYVTPTAFDADREAGNDGYSNLASGGTVPCAEGQSYSTASDVHADLTGLPLQTTYRYRLVVANANGTHAGLNQTFSTLPAVAGVETGPASALTNLSATLNGSFTAEAGVETRYFFEYGTSSNFGHKTPVATVPAPASGTETKSLSGEIEGLVPSTTYHYRLVAENEYGTTLGAQQEFTTFQAPTIEAFSTSDLTATTALLHATINPQGFETTCRFEYGTSVAYGQSEACPEPLSGTVGQPVEVHLEGLQSGVTYHFRVVAESKWGAVSTEDQNFEFFPPACPNSAVRQQTSANYLPDCRAYELVSPVDANGTLLYSGGPTSPYATNPSRFTFTGAFGAIPGAPNVISGLGDLYVATRTSSGWNSHYVGIPGDQTGCAGGPPNNPWSHATSSEKYLNVIPSDPSLSRFLDFNLGTAANCTFAGNGTSDAATDVDVPSNAGYLWNAEGALLERLPTDLESTPGAAAALACPDAGPPSSNSQYCSGDVAASGDLTHFVFSSRTLSFAEPGQPAGVTAAPGSAYDDDLATGKVTLISDLAGGGQIHQDPSYAASSFTCGDHQSFPPCQSEEFIRFPAVSTNGSRILMSTATASTRFCDQSTTIIVCPRFTDTPVHLYLSIDDDPAIEIAPSHAVTYLGATSDISRIFFTSPDQLTSVDEDTSVDLYMWSRAGEEAGHPLTLISKAAPGSVAGAGNTDACSPAGAPPWTSQCGVVPFSGWSYAKLPGGAGGNGSSDSAIASANGDIYFYSPEQLDGDRGVLNQENLYDYRQGVVQYVTTLAPGRHCLQYPFGATVESACADGPIARLQVTPDDSHMAFVTEDRLTSYDNAGHLEMYSYTPATGALVCDSCRPDGQPPTDDVQASQNGLFLTEDGRAFFSTTEALVPRDTNQVVDVYEFVDGRPQLITPGTGTAPNGALLGEVPGLVGVSADGTDVYFSTFDTLISEDHNGNFLKFYDARIDGGFPQPAPLQPCAAAEECHGPGTEAPQLPTQSTAAALSGGNVTSPRKQRPKRHRKARSKSHHRPAGHRHGGAK